ncbi:adenylate kinase [uncultured Faecalibaculum sp.]|uniref:adenylate kinase n=1 Tax=uncultured Faecalibaculum sp. TaxID=1729681 RepID=UPI0025DACF45|nr:adenylate kinase [uncultured Faecalibaculum sp.]
MKRILVIGCAGSGKSTLSRQLRDSLHLPLIYLDQIWHCADGSHINPDLFDRKLNTILETDAWIMDGNYRRTLRTRLNACDTVILLDFPTDVCLRQAKQRIGHKREDLPWVETEFNPEFEDWIRNFRTRNLREILKMLEEYSQTRSIYVLRSHEDIREFVATVRQLEQFSLRT